MQIIQLAAGLRGGGPTLTVRQGVLHAIQTIAIIKLLNRFAWGDQIEILAEVQYKTFQNDIACYAVIKNYLFFRIFTGKIKIFNLFIIYNIISLLINII